MLEWLEKWAIKNLLLRKIETIKLPETWLRNIWNKYSEDIYKKVVKSIDEAIDNVIEKALKEQKIDVGKK